MAASEKNDRTAYRLHYLQADISQVTMVILLFQIPNAILAYFDYVIYGFNRQFFLALALRVFILAVSLLICWLLWRRPTIKIYDWLVFTWALLTGGYMLLIGSARTPGYMYYTIDLAMLVCYYLLLPNRFYFRILPPLLYTMGGLGILFARRMSVDTGAIVLFYLVANLIFFLLSMQLYRFRRQQFRYLLKQEALTEQLNQLASIDELTGIYNRREIFRLGEQELERYHRYGRVFTVMMIDIDHFKRINDTYGHRVGDEVLVNFTEYIKGNVRTEDKFGRFGGEEFVLILPETRMEGARSFVERLGIGSTPIKSSVGDQVLECTASIGITECLPSDTSFEDALYRADEGLYKAKQDGRNRVVLVYGDLL